MVFSKHQHELQRRVAEVAHRINKNVRELRVFVRHDLARDPPFSKLDLVSCRNVLIYFGQSLQRRVLPTLHYALRRGGFLLLGRAGRWPGRWQSEGRRRRRGGCLRSAGR